MTNSYHSGVDIFTPEKPWPKPPVCLACESVMVGRKADGPTGFAEAVAKRKHKHYQYTCPHSGREGHEHLVKLYQETDHFASPTLRKFVERDLKKARRAFRESLIEKGNQRPPG